MKITHRVPIRELKSDPISAAYQAEVDRSTAAIGRQYSRAVKRLESAISRAERKSQAIDRRGESAPQRLKSSGLAAWAEVDLRRAELREIQKIMQPDASAPVKNRGRKSFRPVPITHDRGPT